jgi:phosphoribosylglycinamide formyltransferase-1
MSMLTLGILGSGSGSNMQAILDAIHEGRLKARIALVLSDKPDAFILRRAAGNDIPHAVIDCAGHRSKFPESSQQWTAAKLREAGVDLVCLAGFMRLVKAPLLEAFPSRILNIHPSLLPSFPGVAAWEQAVRAGAKETGVTVHVVDSGMDTGPVVFQEALKLEAGETADELHARLQAIEHRIYPLAIGQYAATLNL